MKYNFISNATVSSVFKSSTKLIKFNTADIIITFYELLITKVAIGTTLKLNVAHF